MRVYLVVRSLVVRSLAVRSLAVRSLAVLSLGILSLGILALVVGDRWYSLSDTTTAIRVEQPSAMPRDFSGIS